jgi:ATP-dependent DNA helicase RecG
MPEFDLLTTGIEYLKGVGPARANLLRKELGIDTFGALLYYFPFRYTDRSKTYKAAELREDFPHVQMLGKIEFVDISGKGPRQRMNAIFADETGSIDLVWFKGLSFLKPKVVPGATFVAFGKPTLFNGRINMAHPELNAPDALAHSLRGALQPVYSSTEKLANANLNSRGIEKLMEAVLMQAATVLGEVYPSEMIKQYGLMPRRESFLQIHFPESAEKLSAAVHRQKFDELFLIQLQMLRSKLQHQKTFRGYVFNVVGDSFNTFYHHHLPFPLTEAQKRVVKEIRKDMGTGRHMNRLLQGDVGSGKTIVALLSMLIAKDNGFQSALMAPTEILAMQHFESLTDLLKGMDVQIALLTGSTKTAQRRQILADLESGMIDLLIGTHALIEEKVKFERLGLAVIDEQHRFGVAQRAQIWKKSALPPHVLVMTATPIPRTLAMTVYGDLDVSVIDELPPGRKPVQTVVRSERHRLQIFTFFKEQITLGRQIYIVYPLIKESEALDLNHLHDGYESIVREFPLPQFRVSIVHGQMKTADREFEMQRFVRGNTQIMVATTVIEVGVNVPNASVMLIENAERFGLSQLHQLRGRVGRGADQSFCILMTGDEISDTAMQRLEVMARTNNGFEIAEEDLKLRGPGDLLGTRQSGDIDLRIANLSTDGHILHQAREAALWVLKTDPQLQHPAFAGIAAAFADFQKAKPNWGRIS